MDKTRWKENRERIKALCDLGFGEWFKTANPRLHYVESDTRRDRVYNTADKDFMEARKEELGITNADILMIFDNLVGRVITDATLRRKLAGKSDFTATEILVLSQILQLTPDEVLSCFNLYPEYLLEERRSDH